MNLKQLKKMISEEYQYWLKEQPVGAPEMPGAGMPGAGMPGVEVGPNDIDATGGGDDSEATLRQIYDMLKDYFEGGGAPAAPSAPAGDMDMDMDMDDEDTVDISDDSDDDGDDDEDDVKEKKEPKKDKKDKKELKERFQKLANIIKG